MRETVNTVTHLIGAILAAIGLAVMCVMAQTPREMLGGLVFGISMILLYSASALYHGYSGKDSVIRRLRKLDHSMIFVLIAGTYTPLCLLVLPEHMGRIVLAVIWGMAAIGVISKLLFMNMPRWLSAGMYLFMGWISLTFIVPLFRALPLHGFIWLVVGGILYTVGAVFYARKPPFKMRWGFGFHEIFHLFILAGSAAHFILISVFVI